MSGDPVEHVPGQLGFDLDVPDPVEPASAGDRIRARREAAIAAGYHPLSLTAASNLRLHPQAGDNAVKCGTCRFRRPRTDTANPYPKCWAGDGVRATRGASSDVLSSWPGCTDWTPR